MKKSRAGRGQKRKRAFLGSPQVEIATGGSALGGRRGLARPAIELSSLPMPQAINRHKGCLSDEFVSSFLSMSISRMMGLRKALWGAYLQAKPGGNHPPQAGWLGAICSHELLKSATSQPGLCLTCLSLEKSTEPARDLYFKLSIYLNLIGGKLSTVENPLLCTGNFFWGSGLVSFRILIGR